MWMPPEFAFEARSWSGDLWRVVESQSHVAIPKLVDTLDEQVILEAELGEEQTPDSRLLRRSRSPARVIGSTRSTTVRCLGGFNLSLKSLAQAIREMPRRRPRSFARPGAGGPACAGETFAAIDAASCVKAGEARPRQP
jgi:hypothetical protein